MSPSLTRAAGVPTTHGLAVGDAEKGCPVSKVLNAAITVDAKLISTQAPAGNRESAQAER